MILCSVIIPAYNCATQLPQCLQSVWQQNIDDIEIIVIDDASTDETPKIMEQFADRIRYFRLPTNRGPSYARNYGIEKAQGRFIALLDADDCWFPDKLARQLAIAEREPDSVIYTPAYWQADRQPVRSFREMAEGRVLLPLLVKNFISTPTVLASRKILLAAGGFPEDLRYAEDYFLWLKLAIKYPFHLVPQTGVWVGRRPTGLSADRKKLLAGHIMALQQIEPLLPAVYRPWCRANRWLRSLQLITLGEEENK
ncbi:MAG: glycosyltransferase family 2 protein [Bacillota bacterium]